MLYKGYIFRKKIFLCSQICISNFALLPFQMFAEKTVGKFSKLVPFFVACSTIGSLNGAILGGSRFVYFIALLI